MYYRFKLKIAGVFALTKEEAKGIIQELSFRELNELRLQVNTRVDKYINRFAEVADKFHSGNELVWFSDFEGVIRPLREGRSFDTVLDGHGDIFGFQIELDLIKESLSTDSKFLFGALPVRVVMNHLRLTKIYGELLELKVKFPDDFKEFINERNKEVWDFLDNKFAQPVRDEFLTKTNKFMER